MAHYNNRANSHEKSTMRIESIIELMKGFPQGASLEEILKARTPPLPKRSLQRYLALFVKEGRLNTSGKARSTRYYLPTIPQQIEGLIPLSSEGWSIQAHVRQPIQSRRPVGYNRNFLDKYRPNESYYLSEKIRKHLFDIGKSPDGERPAGTYARQIFSRLLIDLSWNSSRLEGNTYSLLETELMSLHKGNIARFRIRPSEYDIWVKSWR